MTLQTLSFIFGALLLLVGLIGGGFEVKELKLPKVGWPIRLISIMLGSFFITISLGIITPPKKVVVPNVVDLPQEKAQTVLINRNLKLGNVKLKQTRVAQKGTVLKQMPQAEMLVPRGTPVDLVIAAKSIHSLKIKELEDKISEINSHIKNLENELANSPHPVGPLHELQVIIRKHKKHLAEIISLQKGGEENPDLEAEKSDLQQQLEKLQDEIYKAKKRDELETKINELKKQKKTLQENIEYLTEQQQPTQ